jgi:OmpA-OmpF porin, OOP family
VKEYKHILAPVLLVFLLSQSMVGQSKIDVRNYTAKQLKNFGKNADRLGDIYTAIDFFEPYCKMRTKDAELNYRLAELYFQSRDYVKSEKQFSKVYKEHSDIYPQALYYQAQSLKSQGKYDEAKEIFVKFQKKLKAVKTLNLSASALKDEITGCDMAFTIINNPVKASVEHMNSSINSPHIELSPIAINDSSMIYASLKSDSVQYFNREDTAKIPVRQFYQAKKVGNDWIGGKSMDGPVNIPGVETGNGALSRDGNRFYFTRCAKTWEGKMRCEIFVTKRKGNVWQEPVQLNTAINDPNYTATQPTVGTASKSNMEILYFVSDRPGGRGGDDIWYSIYNPKKNDYSTPKNAGNKINTQGNEM